MTAQSASAGLAKSALSKTAGLWFVTAAIGQWIFLAYVLTVYGGSAVQGNLEHWNNYLSKAWAAGETVGNIASVMHIALAVIILGGGPLQLIPQIRARFPTFHRWNGRSYLLAVVSTAVVGLYMLATRDIGGVSLKLSFVAQSIMIIVFAAIALRFAMARQITRHRRWALRLFMVASAVWFFRIMLMIWVVLTGGVGVDFETGKGPFLEFMAFGQYLPLVVLEVYLRVKDESRPAVQFAMAAFLVVAACATALGVAVATVGMWFPQG